MRVHAVTVTYGNRFHLLKQVIDAALAEGVEKVIVVDNNSVDESRNKLKEYEKELNYKIKVLYLDDNYGSAGGFKRGLEEAYADSECEYIICLDDDNLIPKGTFLKIESIYYFLSMQSTNLMLGLNRPDWTADQESACSGRIKKYYENNFKGFNFLRSVKRKILSRKLEKNNRFFPLQPADISAMGGLFFHKEILSKIGYPNEEFVVYADDHDFTYRFTSSGGHLLMCNSILVKDLDSTTISDKGEKIGHFDKDFSEFKLFYGIRNHTFLSKKFITNKFYFYMNMNLFLIWQARYIFKTSPSLFFKRYTLYLKAIKDGLNNNLGKTF